MAIKVTISTGGMPVPSQAAIIDAMAMTMLEVEKLAADEARLDVRVRSGHTRQSIRTLPVVRLANGVRGGISANDIGRYLEHGTATHSDDPDAKHEKYPIRPRYKKALAWPAAQGPSSMPTGSGRPLSYVESGSHRSQHPPISGQHVRVSGQVKTGIRRLLQSGSMAYQSVYTVRKGVMHPGIRPRPFMQPALESVLPKAPAIFTAMLALVMKRK